ncbi:MAG: hypothetical protein WA127_00145, partial [Methanothrix sp.]
MQYVVCWNHSLANQSAIQVYFHPHSELKTTIIYPRTSTTPEVTSPEHRPDARQDQQVISLDTASIHDHLLDIGIRLEQWNPDSTISGQTHA